MLARTPRATLAVLMLGTLALCLTAPLPAGAQTVGAASPAPPAVLELAPDLRADVEAALREMPADLLILTFARIHAAFRDQLGQDDLRIARALVDYALLAEAEMRARNLALPERTESASDMMVLYELVL